MNELELTIIKKDWLDSESYMVDYIYKNNLQDKLTLKEMASIVGSEVYMAFYLFSDLDDLDKAKKYIIENPEVTDMKISVILSLIEKLNNE